MCARVPLADLQPLRAREISTRYCEPAKDMFVRMLHLLGVCRFRLFPFVALVGLGHSPTSYFRQIRRQSRLKVVGIAELDR